MKVNKDALFENERLKQNDLYSTIKTNNTSDDAITVFAFNVRSLSKHIDDIVSDIKILNTGIKGLKDIRFYLQMET